MKPFLTAEWKHLLMLNYAIDPDVLLPFVPSGTEIDQWNNTTYVSMVGFLFLNTRVQGLSIPFHKNFEEINLRFYVKRREDSAEKRGVVFIKEIVPRYAIAKIANVFYNENYVAHSMMHQIENSIGKSPGKVRYGWSSNGKANCLEGVTEAQGPTLPPAASEAEYITEHYWGYVAQRDGGTLEYKVEHPQWKVWPVSAARFNCDTETVYGRSFVEALQRQPKSAFLAEGSVVNVYKGRRIR